MLARSIIARGRRDCFRAERNDSPLLPASSSTAFRALTVRRFPEPSRTAGDPRVSFHGTSAVLIRALPYPVTDACACNTARHNVIKCRTETMEGIMFGTIRTVALQQELRNCYANLCTLAGGHLRGGRFARAFWKKEVKSVPFLNIYDLPLCAANLFAHRERGREREREREREKERSRARGNPFVSRAGPP